MHFAKVEGISHSRARVPNQVLSEAGNCSHRPMIVELPTLLLGRGVTALLIGHRINFYDLSVP